MRMGSPQYSGWPKMRQVLRSFLAASLAGRVDYTVTTHRKPFGMGHAEILVDAQPVTNFCEDARWYAGARYSRESFVSAAGWYLNRPLAESLVCGGEEWPGYAGTLELRQCLALMDRRVGKRVLRRPLATELADARLLVRYFCTLRCHGEGIEAGFSVPEGRVFL